MLYVFKSSYFACQVTYVRNNSLSYLQTKTLHVYLYAIKQEFNMREYLGNLPATMTDVLFTFMLFQSCSRV